MDVVVAGEPLVAVAQRAAVSVPVVAVEAGVVLVVAVRVGDTGIGERATGRRRGTEQAGAAKEATAGDVAGESSLSGIEASNTAGTSPPPSGMSSW